jgi:uncharacterized membrane protein YgcG
VPPTATAPAIRRARRRLASAAVLGALFLVGPLALSAQAAAGVPPLGTASAFSVLAGTTVTNTGATTIDRSVGVHPGSAVTGESTMVVGGTTHKADAVALQAKSDLTTAYNNAAAQTPPISEDAELGGETLVGGVYNRAAAMGLTGQLTLDGANNPNSVWVFQAGSTLITAPGSSVVLINGANPCNVFWQVGSSATLDTTTHFVGTIMAEATITMNTGATIQGRTLARSGAVNLHNNVFTSPNCAYDQDVDDAVAPTTPTDTPSDTPTDTAGTGGNGGSGSSGGGTGGGNGGSGGGGTDTSQITTIPTGSVDTGLAGPASPGVSPGALLTGTAGVVGFGALALVALRRRRVM